MIARLLLTRLETAGDLAQREPPVKGLPRQGSSVCVVHRPVSTEINSVGDAYLLP